MTCGTCSMSPPGPTLMDACPGSTFLYFMTLLNSLILNNRKISGICERVKPIETPDDVYDFVVIGGGAAGSAVAGRLSEIPEWKVLVLEAGPDEPAGSEIPGFATTFLGTEIIWNYTTTNESNACLSTNGSCAWPSGKNLGGNTVHNGMIYTRGNPTDYNKWAEAGNVGWTWEEVERYFIKGEDNGEIDRVGSEHHGTGGPLSVERFPYIPELGNEILRAAEEAGYRISEDLDGGEFTGFSRVQAMQKKGVRRSSARAYLWPVRNRSNLHVSLNSTATRVIVENKRAVGVEYYKDGQLRRVNVTREVILSAGTVESPHILFLSGIGPRDHLESMNVNVVINLPGVGENLHDHPCAMIPLTVNEPDVYDDNYQVATEYLANQTGPLSAAGTIQVIGILASNETTPEYPDIELYFFSYFANCAPGQVGALQSAGRRTMVFQPSYLHPKCRGRITLASNDPFDLPKIWANYLCDRNDVAGIVEAIKMSVSLLDTEALRSYNFTISDAPLEACSNYEFKSDEYWACVARQDNHPTYHQGGTCKMGPASDPMAVVDPRLRVHGIEGLRVADNSIMPQVPSSNTAAPAMMIGERLADFVKEDWGVKIDQ